MNKSYITSLFSVQRISTVEHHHYLWQISPYLGEITPSMESSIPNVAEKENKDIIIMNITNLQTSECLENYTWFYLKSPMWSMIQS